MQITCRYGLTSAVQQENHTRTKRSVKPCGRYLTSEVQKANNDSWVQLISAGFSKSFTKDLKRRKQQG